MDKFYNQLIENNKKWVAEKLSEDAQFFEKLKNGQKPPLLWIGCSDSRVPANEITGTKPGEVFVTRNIANMVVHSDMSMLSVLDYAVNVLEVQHIIVCGHYGCGGVRAAMSNQQLGLIDNWLRHIKDVYKMHAKELDAISDAHERENRFVEVNVQEQVHDLSKTATVQNAWSNGKNLHVHGWVYDIGNGIVKDLDVSFSDNSKLENVYQFELAQ
ncbi:MAG: carbonate dehydratase [Fulvivirga sp.]|uniref:carbonate dehydratase n=1 Tax=Fulvivirga sp. TaxID=1931237 RepID=UPI0032ED18A7